MKTQSPIFTELDSLNVREPRFIAAVSFDDDNTVFRANLFTYSQIFDNVIWPSIGSLVLTAAADTAPDGTLTAYTFEDTDGSTTSTIWQFDNGGLFDVTKSYTASLHIKKDSIGRATRFCAIRIRFEGSISENSWLYFDTQTGEYTTLWGVQTGNVTVHTVGDYWRIAISNSSVNQSNNTVRMFIYSAWGADINWSSSAAALGTITIWGAQLSESLFLTDYKETVATIILLGDSSTDVTYLTSHSDTVLLSGVPAIDIIHGSIMPRGISGLSQRVVPDKAQHTIGNITVKLLDINGVFTTKINTKLVAGESLRKKSLKIYVGHKDLTNFDDYALRITYLIDDVSYKNGVYTIKSSDIQREARKTLFEPDQAVLTSSITDVDTTIPITTANALIKFITVAHDSIYSTDTSQTVGYIKLDDEVIKHVGVNGGGTAFEGVTRGALNTNAVAHEVTASEIDKKKKIEEYFYLEMAAPKMIYALLTGILDGQSANLPNHWNLGINTKFVRLSDFQNIGNDLWDTTTGEGRIARFIGLEKEEGKKFIEKELLLWLGSFMPVYSDGALGLKRFQAILPYSSWDAYVSQKDIISYGELIYDMDKVINNIAVKWNWIDTLNRFTKINQLIDTNSIDKHGKAPLKEYEFKGVFTGVHSDNDINSYFGQIRDRYTSPPLRLKIDLIPEWNVLDVGDTIRLDLPQTVDYHIDQILDRIFEVQQLTTNWVTGQVSLDLFGGVEPSNQVSLSTTNVLLDSYYNTGGTELSTVLTIVGGVVTVNGSLTGAVLNTSAIFYYEGDLEIAAGVVITCTANIMLRIRGFLTINGSIVTTGTSIQDGIVGRTVTGRPAEIGQRSGSARSYAWLVASRNIKVGIYQSVPSFDLTNTDGSSIGGVPSNLLGVIGRVPQLGRFFNAYLTTGGLPGAGGGGLVIVSRGAAYGGSGSIVTSGDIGGLGSVYNSGGVIQYAQSGSGGHGGGVLFLIDGNFSAPTFTASNSISLQGVTPTPGTINLFAQNYDQRISSSSRVYGEVMPTPQNQFLSTFRVQYIPQPITPFVFLPAEAQDEALGYGTGPPEWFDILDGGSTKPDDNANLITATSQIADDAGLGGTADWSGIVDDGGKPDDNANIAPTTYAQDAAPTVGLLAGDIWIDTNDSNKIYRYDGAIFILLQDTEIGVAQTSADDAQATADVKIVTYYQSGAPSSPALGDLWLDTDDSVLRRWNNTIWEDTSTIGATWDSNVTGQPATISYLNGFVQASNWTTRVSGRASDTLVSVTYGLVEATFSFNPTWLVGTGSFGGTILKSNDGENWSEKTHPDSGERLNGFAFNGTNLFVGVGSVAATPAETYIITSPTGDTWTRRTAPDDEAANDIDYGDGIFVAVGNNLSAAAVDCYIITSPDGITWTERSNPLDAILNGVVYNLSLDLWAVVGESIIMTSPDGITWTSRTAPAVGLNSVTVDDNGRFVAVGDGDASGSYILTSDDGITWTRRLPPAIVSSNLFGVAWGNGVFVATGGQEFGGVYSYILASVDGVIWSRRIVAIGNNMNAIAFGNGLFTMVGNTEGIFTSLHS